MIDFKNLGGHSEDAARASLQNNRSLQMLLDQHVPDHLRTIVEQLLIVMYVAGYGQALTDNDERIAPLDRDTVDGLAQALRSEQ